VSIRRYIDLHKQMQNFRNAVPCSGWLLKRSDTDVHRMTEEAYKQYMLDKQAKEPREDQEHNENFVI